MDYGKENAVFSPSGRLFQVEFALEAVKRSLRYVALSTREGILLAGKARQAQQVNEMPPPPKFLKINSNIVCGGGGMLVDFNLIVSQARHEALRHRLVRHREIPCSRLLRRMSELCQSHTAHRDLRVLASQISFAGYDKQEGFQIFVMEPGGSYRGYKAFVSGFMASAASEAALKDYSEDLEWVEIQRLAVEVLAGLGVTSQGLEMVQLKLDEDGNPKMEWLSEEEVKSLGAKATYY